MRSPRHIFRPISGRRTFLSAAAAGILIACLLSGAAEGADPEGAQLIKEIITGAKSSADAAAKLMRAAISLNDVPKTQAMFCRKAYEYGVKTAAGQGEALQALDMLARIAPQQADEWVEKRVSLYRLMYARCKPAERVKLGTRLVALMRDLADASAEKGQWKSALKFYSAAMRTATALRLRDRAEIAKRIRDVSIRMKRAERFESLKKSLLANPGNDTTRNKVIEICLLERDSPAQAAKFLTEDGDEMLRTYIPLAAKSMDELTESNCLQLGRWYRSLAKNSTAKTRNIVALNRTITYYERYLDLHTNKDAARDKVSDALVETFTARRKLGGSLLPEGAVLAVTFEKPTLTAVGVKVYIIDSSSKHHRGLLTGGILATGVAGRAMKFTGKTHIDFGNPKALQIAGSQTICMWLNVANFTNRQNPMNKAYGGEGTWTIERNGTINYWCGSSGKNASPYTGYLMTKPLKPGQWAHVATVRDAKTRKVTWYKDGKPVSARTLKYRASASKYPLLIGKGYVSSYQGMMDELAIFNRALSAKEIGVIYQMGTRGLTLK
ncbi:MAG: LamG domain-containing protein [Phycisphaerae bacterium]|jgi:hypothetical protein|nr:LamG domain-containing protein [Phycisphaerae bacterium]